MRWDLVDTGYLCGYSQRFSGMPTRKRTFMIFYYCTLLTFILWLKML